MSTGNNISTKILFTQAGIWLLYCLCLFSISLFAFRKPHYNWDMLAYMALAVQTTHANSHEIHRIVYQSAKANIPAADYANLIGSDYRKMLAVNDAAFLNTLPFYAVKPLYVQLVILFTQAGFSLPSATVLPSILFYCCTGLLLLHWLLRHLSAMWAFVISVCIMLSGFMVFTARLSTPDCVSYFLLISAFYYIQEKPSLVMMSVLFALSIFARLDNIVPCCIILSFLCFSRRWKKLHLQQYFGLILLLCACYVITTAITLRPFGWNIFYYPTYARYMNLSHTFNHRFSVNSYLALVMSQATTAIVFYNIVFFIFIAALVLYAPVVRMKDLSFDQAFSILLLLIIFFRFCLYPDLSDRFNIAYYLYLLITLVKRYTAIFALTTTVHPVKDGGNKHI